MPPLARALSWPAKAPSTGGWYDLKVHERVADFVGLQTLGSSEATREQSRLIIGPWDHQVISNPAWPDRQFGILAEPTPATAAGT